MQHPITAEPRWHGTDDERSPPPDASGRSINAWRGRLVGGCSAVNAAIALRGHPRDYDGWAELGNPGWSFGDILPYFRRLESDADFRTPYHDGAGPLPRPPALAVGIVGPELAPGDATDLAGVLRARVETYHHPVRTSAWDLTRSVERSSTRSASMPCTRACASWTPRSCRTSRQSIPTCRRSCLPI